MVLSRNVLYPLPQKIETFEDVKKWIESWNDFFNRTYRDLLNDSIDVHDVVDSPLRRASDYINGFDYTSGIPLELLRFIFQTYAEVQGLDVTESSTKDLVTATRGAATPYSDAVNVTGTGWLIFMATQGDNAGSDGYAKVTIDGVVVWEDNFAGLNKGYAHQNGNFFDTGGAATANPLLLMFPFATSLQIEAKNAGTNTSTFQIRYSLK
jgi:hypothetical protein